ncbi:hypothetical protein [Endozoicomonas acroporae]|uniref:hypothetical protein n=1 Tax=Endozoicomonas acroporae TaxID=1701104 RepID=UPI0011AF4950|nr:hypothetical protein [Endozoicomonas acroporae]
MLNKLNSGNEPLISGVSPKSVSPSEQRKALTVEQKKDKQTIRKLERELKRKDKALAETAALLVLTKKAREIWGEPEDD